MGSRSRIGGKADDYLVTLLYVAMAKDYPLDITCQRLSTSAEALALVTMPNLNSAEELNDMTSPGVLLPLLLLGPSLLFNMR